MAETDSVSTWSINHVISWFKGLDDSLQCYIPNLEEASITGAQLLALTYEDLNNLGIVSIGHQEIILEATELLKQLHFDLDNENLQSRALDLNCRCRALRSSISSRKRNDGGHSGTEALSMGPNIPLLRLACEVLDSSKLLVMWLDRPPFWSQPEIRHVRGNLVRLSYELSTTVQQSVFVCVIDDAASAICKDMEVSANNLIVSNDPMTIQPASLEVAHLVNKDSSAGLGLYIKATFEGHHVITGSKEGSISSRIRRIGLGDEVVAVSGQTVIGWQLSKLVGALKQEPGDISISLKKRPYLHASSNTPTPTSRRQVQERVLTVPPPVSPIRKVADSRKNSIEDVVDTQISHLPEENDRVAKKKHKFKKRKTKSASNLLSGSGGATKRSVSSQRNSIDSLGTSSHNSSLHSVSSIEMLSASNLMKNTGIRGSLENLLKRDKRSKKTPHKDETHRKGKENKSKFTFSNSLDDLLKIKKGTGKKGTNNISMKKTKQARKTRSASHNDVLSDTKGSANRLVSLITPWQPESLSRNLDSQTVPEPPTSPLDFLVIPPPPQAPYTPRHENVLRISIDSANNLSSTLPQMEKNDASESPNSLMDIEHCRRFTVIGTEQMGDKWYNSLLYEVNAKRAKRSRVTVKQALEKVAETTASDDSVFFNTTVETIPEGELVVRRPKPRLRNRPASMPPDYYSPSKLQQFRMNRGKLKSGLDEIPQVAHHVDSQGVKKLAPLNSITEDASSSDVRRLSGGFRNSWCSNNNNNSANVLLQRGTNTPVNSSGNTVNISSSYRRNMSKESNSLEKPDRFSKEPRVERPRSVSEGLPHQTGLLKLKTPIRQQSPVKRNQTDIPVEEWHSKKPSIAEELTKYFLRKNEGTMLEGQFSPPVFSPTTPLDDSAFASPVKVKASVASSFGSHKPMMPPTYSLSPAISADSVSKTRQYRSPVKTRKPIMHPVVSVSSAKSKPSITSPDKARTPMMPPVAKPRTKLRSTIEEKSQTSIKETNSQKSTFLEPTNFQSSPKKFLFESHKTDEVSQGHQPSVNLATRLLANARASPTSRGSYVAAIDDGYARDDMKEAFDKRNYDETTLLDANNSSFKVIDGVKVRLRKPATKSPHKKGFLLEEMRSQRRISCRDLGQGECNGWLLKKKLISNSSLSSKWSKRWVVLKDKAVYCYRTPDDDKAESYISLPGYQVTPAPECKKKFAFRVSHPKRKTFYFASDRQMDMSRWMNKMGLAAIEYGFSTQFRANGDQHLNPDEYYSESDSEETFLSQSETSNHTSSSTPNSSPEKATKLKTVLKTRSEYDAARQMPGQPILNRSARFPKEKAKMLHEGRVTSYTQTSDSLQRGGRNRSKSDAAMRRNVSEFQTTESVDRHSSHFNVSLESNITYTTDSTSVSSPSKQGKLSPNNRMCRREDKKRELFLETTLLSGSLEALHPPNESGRKSSHTDQELRNIAANRAEEVGKRSSENISVAEIKESSKSTNDQGKVSPKPRSRTAVADSSPRRDAVGRPRVKTEASLTDNEQRETGSIGDLCKALQHAEVDIHGIKRRTTLRRKMTVLSRNPIKNESMLKKRALERQLKALEGELEYYNLLDEKKITSKSLHQWINQHPSLFAELGTIRKMSKIRRKPAEQVFTAGKSPDADESHTSGIVIQSKTARPMSYSEIESSGKDDEKTFENNPTSSQPGTLGVVLPKPRPRSCAMSNSDFERMKPKARTSMSSPNKNSSPINTVTRSEMGYLETDL